MFCASDHALFEKPVVVMKISSKAELSVRAVVTCIQIDNKNNTRLKFQAERTEGLEQCGIKKKVRKQAQKQVQQVT